MTGPRTCRLAPLLEGSGRRLSATASWYKPSGQLLGLVTSQRSPPVCSQV